MRKIAFNTANLVARESNYRFALSTWGDQHKRTVENTTDRVWSDICSEIAAAGYTAVEVWVAHVDPATVGEKGARRRAMIMHDFGLAPIALAGPLTEQTAAVCQAMGIPRCCGGLPGTGLDSVRKVHAATGVAFCYENHPEKSVEDIVTKIGGGGDGVGVAVDTGWLGTRGIDAPAAIRKLGPLVHHVHVKDVKAAGAHHTVPLGEGCVNIAGVLAALADIGFKGWYSWEDEPEDRNPMDIAAQMHRYVAQHMR